MRIGYLLPEFPGLTHIIFWREILRMRELGNQVALVATRAPKYRSPHAFASEPCAYLWPPSRSALAGLPGPLRLLAQLHYVLTLAQGGWRERLRVLAMLPASWALAHWLHRERIEHLHVHSFANALYIAALANILTDVPYSATLHGGIDGYGLNHDAKLKPAAFACAISQITRREIDAVAPGKALANDVPCGVNMDVFRYVERSRAPELRLISVGRLHHGKGIEYTLQALAAIRDNVAVRYTLVGAGPNEADLRARVSELGLDGIVTFAGPGSEVEVAEHLAAHDVAVLTSVGTFEATATAVREAMATGMPAIMSRIGDAERMIDEGVTGFLVEQRDVAAIADRISWFAANPERIAEMGRAAYDLARDAFADTVGARVLHDAVYRERVSARSAPVPQRALSPISVG